MATTVSGLAVPTTGDAPNVPADFLVFANSALVKFMPKFKMDGGTTTAITGAGGEVTLSHNLGVVPRVVFYQLGGGGTGAVSNIAKVVHNGKTDTQIQYLVRRTDTGAVIAGNSVVVDWFVLYW